MHCLSSKKSCLKITKNGSVPRTGAKIAANFNDSIDNCVWENRTEEKKNDRSMGSKKKMIAVKHGIEENVTNRWKKCRYNMPALIFLPSKSSWQCQLSFNMQIKLVSSRWFSFWTLPYWNPLTGNELFKRIFFSFRWIFNFIMWCIHAMYFWTNLHISQTYGTF